MSHLERQGVSRDQRDVSYVGMASHDQARTMSGPSWKFPGHSCTAKLRQPMPFHCGVHVLPPPEAVPVIDGYRGQVNDAVKRFPKIFLGPPGRLKQPQLRVQLLEDRSQLLPGVTHVTVSLDGTPTMLAAPLCFP